jgi:PAS domain S-box-containing protein
VLSEKRMIVDCNRQLCDMFLCSRELLIGQSFQVLYPSAHEFERMGERLVAALTAQGWYADERIMRRANGENFWCHVSGRTLMRDDPHALAIWSFEDVSAKRPVTVSLTAREREVAAHLMEGKTSKVIGKHLGISPRTVDIYRAKLMKKYQAHTTGDLVHKMVKGLQ